METLRYTTTDREGTAVLSLSGELVFETARKVERELRNIEERKPTTIAIDLSGLSMIDSTGLALVVSADSRARGEGRRLMVVEGPDSVQRVFRMTRLDDRLDIVPSLDAGVDTGANRSPWRSTRSSTSAESNVSMSASFAARASSTSSQVTGVDTVGRSFARSEYTHTVVLCSSFCDQSTNTLPWRSSLAMFDTTSSGCCFSTSSAHARENVFVPGTYSTPDVFSGTYSCSPFEPDVFGNDCRSKCSK